MNVYKDNIIIFGGGKIFPKTIAGKYSKLSRRRATFNDVREFNTYRMEWEPRDNKQSAALRAHPRTYHGADIIGHVLVVYGGYDTEEKQILDDLKFYDMGK
jgi:hypothetical protein